MLADIGNGPSVTSPSEPVKIQGSGHLIQRPGECKTKTSWREVEEAPFISPGLYQVHFYQYVTRY